MIWLRVQWNLDITYSHVTIYEFLPFGAIISLCSIGCLAKSNFVITLLSIYCIVNNLCSLHKRYIKVSQYCKYCIRFVPLSEKRERYYDRQVLHTRAREFIAAENTRPTQESHFADGEERKILQTHSQPYKFSLRHLGNCISTRERGSGVNLDKEKRSENKPLREFGRVFLESRLGAQTPRSLERMEIDACRAVFINLSLFLALAI